MVFDGFQCDFYLTCVSAVPGCHDPSEDWD